MVFSSPKCTSCVFGNVIVTSFKTSLKYSLHLPRISFSFLSKTPFWSLINLAVWCRSSYQTHDGLPEHVVCLPVIGIHFMSEFLARLHFRLFHRAFCGFSRLSLPRMQRRVGFVMKPCLVGYFPCSNTIVHLLLPPRGYFLPLFATTSRWPPHTREAVEATAALKLNSHHSTYATAVDFGNSRNNDDTQDTNIFLTTSLSARTSHFMR